MSFIDRLEKLLEENRISKNKFLKDIGVASGAFGNWKSRGSLPSAETLTKISEYFNVSTDYLLGKTEETNQSKEESDIPLNSVVVSRNGIRTTVELKPEEALTFENLLKQIREAHGDE